MSADAPQDECDGKKHGLFFQEDDKENLFLISPKRSRSNSSSSCDIYQQTSKRVKVETQNQSKSTKSRKCKPKKCPKCLQLVDSNRLKVFDEDGTGAVDEFAALSSECLSLCGTDDITEHPQHRLINFAVYDEFLHLCPFDSGLLERNVKLYFSGYLKAIYDDSPALEGGVAVKMVGPIDQWYIAGFDGGQHELVGFTTAYADYLLSHPSPQYRSIFDTLREKTFLSKVVIEQLEYNPSIEMEDLLLEIQQISPPDACPRFNEETMIRHANFLLEQIQSYDEASGESWNDNLMSAPAVTTLIEFSGYELPQVRSDKKSSRTRPTTKTTRPRPIGLSKAIVTPLIKSCFDEIFNAQLERSNIEMGDQTSADLECQQRSVKTSTKKSVTITSYDIELHGLIKMVGDKTFYDQAQVGEVTISVGDYVTVNPADPSDPLYIARVASLFSEGRGKYFHAHWLLRGRDTILGELHEPWELFLADCCDDEPIGSILEKVSVEHYSAPNDWRDLGGRKVSSDHRGQYYFKLWYDIERARFEVPIAEYLSPDGALGQCPSCVRKLDEEMFLVPCLTGDERSLVFRGERYLPGEYVYLQPSAYSMRYKHRLNPGQGLIKDTEVDEDIYTEYYRKRSYIKGSNEKVSEPYRIGQVLSFSEERLGGGLSTETTVRVLKLYRVENTRKGQVHEADVNKLYISSDEVTVRASEIAGKCTVKRLKDIADLREYVQQPDSFYFSEGYDSRAREVVDLSDVTKRFESTWQEPVSPSKFSPSKVRNRKLRTLDVFSGCGGLSEGLHQAGVAQCEWAIECVEDAAKAFQLNNPTATVFNADCNKVLELALQDQAVNELGQAIPRRGDVELLCGGPPCQGFSGMNRFNAREYSQFKNSLVATFLSYCEFYRPKFFLLENVKTFVSYKKGMVLKLCLSALVRMGYQCTTGVLQAGSYGVAQTRRRAFILAAAPGEMLPRFPEPRHVFTSCKFGVSFSVDGTEYRNHISRYGSAPYRTITVRDVMSDLPAIESGAGQLELDYDIPATSWYQRNTRGNCQTLTDHICKELNPLVEARITYIPLEPGCDWRDLPNISVTLRDGSRTSELIYTHRKSRDKSRVYRGVCACAAGGKCDPMDRQSNTLIPWCLPHTADRHNHWAGLYGRVNWDGFFSTTITNPEPMGKQGRVLHPEQHRLVSVRECARSQGFPDSYRFHGNIHEKHRQIGNAVPPPLARAIGDEIRKCLGNV